MKTRWRAMTLVACLGLVPMFGWASNALLALVTLRMGMIEGAVIYVAGLAPLLVAAVLGSFSNDIKLLVLTLTFVAALLLATEKQLFMTILCVSVASVVFYTLLADREWSDFNLLKSQLMSIEIKHTGSAEGSQLSELPTFNSEDQPLVLDTSGKLKQALMSGNLVDQLLVNVVVINILVGLFLGRWWQAILYNPGGFQREFHELEAPKSLVGALALAPILLYGAFKMEAAPWVVSLQLPLLILGISMVHFWSKRKGLVSGWLVLFYITLPWTYLFVIMLGVADTFFGFKRNLKSSDI